jgi:hypothetical protein
MAYMNSGLEMKTTQYNWKIISAILLIFLAACVLVAMKLLNSSLNTQKITAVVLSPAALVAQPAIASVPDKKMAAGPAVNKTASAVPAHNSPEITHPQAVVPIPAVTTKRIVCSADDRAAQLCQ